jgi:hypothetical protein
MDDKSLHSSTSAKAGTLLDGALTRWIVLVVAMTVIVLDLAGVVQVPTDDLLGLLLYVL